MPVFDDLGFFQRIASRGSLTAVAYELGISLAAVSKRLSRLEQRLGVQLVQRTTRRLELTPEGILYLEGSRPIMQALEELESAVSNRQAALRGRLSITASLGFGRRHVAPIVSAFAQQHPELELSLELTSHAVRLLDDGVDVDIRVGEPPDSRLISKRLLANPRILCAAPSYLARKGTPKTVADLAFHNCIVLRQHGSEHAIWRFQQQGRDFAHRVTGLLSSNDGEVAMRLALDGHGLILRSRWDVQEHLHQGRLKPILTDYQAPKTDIFAVYQYRKHVPARILVFVRYLAHALGERFPDDWGMAEDA